MAAARRPIITLTTDFGTADHYVAAMKGVILSLAPHAAIVDITHEVPPHDVMEAGWILRNAWEFFPPRTVHLAVTDPGVGTARRPILAAAGGHWFVGPDNGIFSWIFASAPPREIRAIRPPRRAISATFHGRDLFAPAAALLARGARAATLGKPVRGWERLELPPLKIVRSGRLNATVIHVDRFGNVILNLSREGAATLAAGQDAARLTAVTPHGTISRHVTTYAEIPEGAAALLFNSSGYLELAARQSRADRLLGLARGASVPIQLAPA